MVKLSRETSETSETKQVMRINESDVTWEERRSPGGRYQLSQRNLSLRLGGKKDVGEWGGGHPFDVAQVRIPPGAANYPAHAHTTTWEYYLVTAGTCEIYMDDERVRVNSGDHILCPPGVVHQVSNVGDTDLCFYVIANNPRSDIIHYPHSNKWMIKPQRKWFRMNETDYYDGEE